MLRRTFIASAVLFATAAAAPAAFAFTEGKDADYIIYNSTIDGELKSLDALLVKSSLLADFKAVKEGRVWCTEKNLFQESMGLGTMILDIHRMLTEEDPDPSEMTYIYPLR